MKLQDGTSEVVACCTEKLIEEHWGTCEEILNHFNYLTDPDIDEKADEMCAKAIKLMMQVQQYDKIAEITEEKPAHEDYSNIQNNDPKKDFIKKWNQYSDKYDVFSYEDLDENEISEKTEEAEFNRQLLTEAAGEFWNLLTTDEKLIINYRINGWNYDEIAEQMGYKNHTPIVKKRQKIESKFRRFLEEEYNFT